MLPHLARAALTPLMCLLLLLRLGGGVVLRLLLFRVPPHVTLLGGLSLHEKSALGGQLHMRIVEYCSWPAAFVTLMRMHWEVATGRRWHTADALYSATATWCDSLGRSGLDVVVGIGACLVLSRLPVVVAAVLRIIHTFGDILHIDVLRAWVDWLMGLPAGLKLNHFAGRKIGGAVLTFIHNWEYITTFLTPWEPAIVVAVGLVGLGGCTLLLAVTADVLDLATIHLYTLHRNFQWLHNRQVALLGSLWNLFRGKKQNVLRRRVDSNDYDMAQLLLGTLFFTVVIFLGPTTLVYYAFFLAMYGGILCVRGAIWWLITVLILNNMPLFALYCTLLQPQRLPAGIHLVLRGTRLGGQRARERVVSTLTTLRATVPGQLSVEESDEVDVRDGAVLDGASACVGAGATLIFHLRRTASAGAGSMLLAPLAEAAAMATRRFSVGLLLHVVLFGEPVQSLFAAAGGDGGGAGGGGASAAGSRAATKAVASTGISFGIVNAAANAPVEAAASASGGCAADADRSGEPRMYRVTVLQPPPHYPPWQSYWHDLACLAAPAMG